MKYFKIHFVSPILHFYLSLYGIFVNKLIGFLFVVRKHLDF